MRRVFALLIVAGFLMAGCASSAIKGVDVYTFEKDRVDQAIKGNRGYLTGKVPEAPAKTGESKRTLIGVDIELPGFISGSGDEEEIKAPPQKVQGSSATKKARKKTMVKAEKKAVAADTVEDTGAADEWIK